MSVVIDELAVELTEPPPVPSAAPPAAGPEPARTLLQALGTWLALRHEREQRLADD